MRHHRAVPADETFPRPVVRPPAIDHASHGGEQPVVQRQILTEPNDVGQVLARPDKRNSTQRVISERENGGIYPCRAYVILHPGREPQPRAARAQPETAVQRRMGLYPVQDMRGGAAEVELRPAPKPPGRLEEACDEVFRV